MATALSNDLRKRILAAVDGDLSCRQAAERFGISASSAIRWADRRRRTGCFAPKALGGDRRSGRIEAHGGLILAVVDEKPDITLSELRSRLAEKGIAAAISTLWRFFKRHGYTRKKKTAHAAEPDRPDIVKRRRAWFKCQLDLDPERLVFMLVGMGGRSRVSGYAPACLTTTGRPRPSWPVCASPG
jgi:transposase